MPRKRVPPPPNPVPPPPPARDPAPVPRPMPEPSVPSREETVPPAEETFPTGVPTGTVPRGRIAGGGPWSLITKWRPQTWAAGRKHGVPWSMLEAMMVVESGGTHDIWGAGGAFGLMQVKPSDFGEEMRRKFGYDVRTEAGQIYAAAAILGGDADRSNGMDPETAFLTVYYPVRDKAGNLCRDCKGESGHTPRMYLEDIARYRKILEQAAGTAPEPEPDENIPKTIPATANDALLAITGGKPKTVSYGFCADAGLPYYQYGIGRLRPETNATRANRGTLHTGVDLVGPVGEVIFAPVAGTVVCAGTGDGPGAWRTGCAAFGAEDGVGRFEMVPDADPNTSIIFGHCRRVLVLPGKKVAAGQPVAEVGTYRGAHNHVEVRRWHGSDYTIHDPLPEIARLMAGAADDARPAYREVAVAGMAAPILLPADIPFRVVLTPLDADARPHDRRPGANRSGKPLAWRGIVHHETGNARVGAGADMHADWQWGGTPGHPDGRIGVHFYADDREVVQCIPVDEQGVHAGDARNGTHLAVERCVNADGDRTRAERHAQELEAALLRFSGAPTAAALVPHHAGSGCPAQTNARGAWGRWVQIVDAKRANAVPIDPIPPPAKRFPVDLPDEVVKWLFPLADPNGPVTRAWMARGCPKFHEFYDADDGYRYWAYAGSLLRSKGGLVEEVRP